MEVCWVLFVEDDPIFVMLFSRAWKKACPEIALVSVTNLKDMNDALHQAQCPPSLIVMDRSLPDGDGHQAALALDLPCHCWSALGEIGATAKPQGKAALELAVESLAKRARL